MVRHRYLVVDQRSLLVLGVLQLACAGLAVVCGCMDAAFRKNTALSGSRTPLWGGLVMASPGVLALVASQRKHSVLVRVMMAAAALSCLAALLVCGYAGLTLTYGEEDEEVFHRHHSQEVTFVLHGMVKGANATILLSAAVSLLLSALIGYLGSRSLPPCGCYDTRSGLETLVPQCDPGDTEMVCTWTRGDNRLFNSPPPPTGEEEEQGSPRPRPAYSRLT